MNNQKLHTAVTSVGPLALCLAFMNSCLNPILYVFMCDEFQKKLKQSVCFVLESALAEDPLSFMSSRSLSSHLSWMSRKSDSSAPLERNDKAFTLNFTESEAGTPQEKETLSTEWHHHIRQAMHIVIIHFFLTNFFNQ